MMSKTVAIVGAGPCGLVAYKEMREAGHRAFVLESSGVIGGVFSHPLPYYNLTISNYFMAFSDYPPENQLEYSTMAEYLKYIHGYADHFGLRQGIEFHSSLESAELNSAGKWVLTIEKRFNGEGEPTIEKRIVDALVVASGCHREPRLPDFGDFTGERIHSSMYTPCKKQSIKEKNQSVLLIGTGESAADISADVAEVARELTIWSRRPPLLAPRVLQDVTESYQIAHPGIPLLYHIEFHTASRITNSYSLSLYSSLRRLSWNTFLSGFIWAKWLLTTCKEMPLRGDQSAFVTKNARMAETVASGKASLVISPKATFQGKTVTFADGTQREIDAVLYCTGYKQGFPFLKVEHSVNPRAWFKHCFPPNYGDKLFFIGFARPHQGGIPACAEMLSRYGAMILSGKRKLPIDYAERAAIEGANEKAYYALDTGTHSLVDYFSFIESVARLVDCTPRLPWDITFCFYGFILAGLMYWVTEEQKFLIITTVLFISQFVLHGFFLPKFMYYPMWPAWYRQRGPGKKPHILNAVLSRFPVSHNLPLHPLLVAHMVLMCFQKVLNIVLLVPSALYSTFIGGNIGTRGSGWWMFDRPKKSILHDVDIRLRDMFSM